MKKAFISSLIMTVMVANISLANISSVQAATTDNTVTTTGNNVTTTDNTIKVSLDNIRDIMIENNLDLKILDNKLKIAKETYQDAKDTKDTKDSAVANAKNDVTSATATKNAADATNLTAATTALQIATEHLSTATTALQTAETALTKAKNDLKTARDNYDKGVEDKVYAAQEAYITYLSDLSTTKINEDTVKSNEKKEQVYKLQYESGFISKNEYTSKLQGNTSVNDSNTSKNTEELDKIKLCNTLGISSEENITFSDITADFQVISKINYEDDLKQMLDNNVDIKLANDDITTLNDEIDAETNTTDSTDTIDNYKKDNAEINLKLVINTKETDFKGKYNDLMTSYNSIKSSYDAIIQQQKEYQITQVKYDYGFISKNGVDGVDTAKLTLDKANAKFIKDRNECYLKYLKYIEMKEGY